MSMDVQEHVIRYITWEANESGQPVSKETSFIIFSHSQYILGHKAYLWHVIVTTGHQTEILKSHRSGYGFENLYKCLKDLQAEFNVPVLDLDLSVKSSAV
ncbi:MAG: hypothetical protein SFY70_06915 [Bacteroidia bacterium]|nr:hypothetical protein [Bacteroidia bacterium]